MQSGKWEARLGQTKGRSSASYIGLFDDEAEAAEAYDMAAVTEYRPAVATNFDSNVRVCL